MDNARKSKLIREVLGIVCGVVMLWSMVAPERGDTRTAAVYAATQPATQVITDSNGRKVSVPTNINRIGDAWHAHNVVLTMLGAGDKIVATVLTPQSRPWLYRVNPALGKAATVFTTSSVNLEELLKTKPDVVFLPTSDKNADKISALGIPVLQMGFTDFDGLKRCFSETGAILGGKALAKARKYITYLDQKLAMVTAVTNKIPKEQRPRVLHVTALTPLVVDGRDTIINAWIETAGGVNAAAEVSGNNREVTFEQILKWNPDVIVLSSTLLGNGGTDLEKVLNDPRWKQVAAVQKSKVFYNPDGAFMWDRYSAEEALEIQWAAKTLHPDRFKQIDMVKETCYFYKTFFNYPLRPEEALRILAAQPPVAAQ